MSEVVEEAGIEAVIDRIERYRDTEGVDPSSVDIIRWTLEAAAPAASVVTSAGRRAMDEPLKSWAREMMDGPEAERACGMIDRGEA